MTDKEQPTLKKATRHISVLDKKNSENELTKIAEEYKGLTSGQILIKVIKNIFCWIIKIYLKPLTYSDNTRAFALAMIVALLYAASYYSNIPVVPAFSQLKTAEGIVDFDKPKKRGTDLIIRQNNKLLVLICPSDGTTDDCIYKQQREIYRGKHAKVWWVEVEQSTLFGAPVALVQLQIEHEIVISYEQQKKSYQLLNSAVLNIWYFLFLFCLYLIGMPLAYQFKNQKIRKK